MSQSRAYNKLQLDIKDIVYNGVPLNLHCGNCGRELDVTTVIDKSIDTDQWDKMGGRIIQQVVYALSEIIKEVSV